MVLRAHGGILSHFLLKVERVLLFTLSLRRDPGWISVLKPKGPYQPNTVFLPSISKRCMASCKFF